MSISKDEKFKRDVLLDFLKASRDLLEGDLLEIPFEKVYVAWKRFLLEMLNFLFQNFPPVLAEKVAGQSSRINLYTVGSMYRRSTSKYGQSKSVPFIRMSGLWLGHYGFCIGSRFEVYASGDQLILKKLDTVDHLHATLVGACDG